jgi:hypothetical protein
MDAKQRQLLSSLHEHIVAGDFGEVDILALLILLREEAPARGPVRELADFVAHRRRTWGRVHEYMLEVKRRIDEPGSEQVNIAPGVYGEPEIAAALDSALEAHRLSALSHERSRQVQIALLCMLQGVAMLDEKKRAFGELRLTVMPEAFMLAGIVTLWGNLGARMAFPALGVTNDCLPVTHQMLPEDLLTIVVRGGTAVFSELRDPQGPHPWARHGKPLWPP